MFTCVNYLFIDALYNVIIDRDAEHACCVLCVLFFYRQSVWMHAVSCHISCLSVVCDKKYHISQFFCGLL